jgi:acyl carrier protein
MQNTHTEIEAALIECLKAAAEDNAPDDIGDDMDVLKTWDLDSEDGIDLALDLGPRLGIEIPLRDNPLIEEDRAGRKRARSFREVVDYLARQQKSQTPASRE